jgi:hypothetical protein
MPNGTSKKFISRCPAGLYVTVKPMMRAARTCDKRRQARIPATGTVIMAYGEGENLGFEPVRVVDCSPQGVGIVLHRPLPAGSSFLLKLILKPTAFAVYNVRHCRPAENGYVIGAELHGFIGSPHTPEPYGETICKAILAG